MHSVLADCHQSHTAFLYACTVRNLVWCSIPIFNSVAIQSISDCPMCVRQITVPGDIEVYYAVSFSVCTHGTSNLISAVCITQETHTCHLLLTCSSAYVPPNCTHMQTHTHTCMYDELALLLFLHVCLHVVVMKSWLSFSNGRCWWCYSCSPSKLEVFEEGHNKQHEPCASVANCWLVWEVAGSISHGPQTLWGRYEMCIQIDVDVCSHSVPAFTVVGNKPVW